MSIFAEINGIRFAFYANYAAANIDVLPDDFCTEFVLDLCVFSDYQNALRICHNKINSRTTPNIRKTYKLGTMLAEMLIGCIPQYMTPGYNSHSLLLCCARFLDSETIKKYMCDVDPEVIDKLITFSRQC